jgi:hypothetical protein
MTNTSIDLHVQKGASTLAYYVLRAAAGMLLGALCGAFVSLLIWGKKLFEPDKPSLLILVPGENTVARFLAVCLIVVAAVCGAVAGVIVARFAGAHQGGSPLFP